MPRRRGGRRRQRAAGVRLNRSWKRLWPIVVAALLLLCPISLRLANDTEQSVRLVHGFTGGKVDCTITLLFFVVFLLLLLVLLFLLLLLLFLLFLLLFLLPRRRFVINDA